MDGDDLMNEPIKPYQKIHNEDQLQAAHNIIESLMDKDDPINNARLSAVVSAVEEYEREMYPIGEPTLIERIKFRIDQMMPPDIPSAILRFAAWICMRFPGARSQLSASDDGNCYHTPYSNFMVVVYFSPHEYDGYISVDIGRFESTVWIRRKNKPVVESE